MVAPGPWRRAIAALALGLAGLLAVATGEAGAATATRSPGAQAVLPQGPLRPEGRWLVDATGRTIIVHGLEIARKTPPYRPPVGSLTGGDARNLEQWGFDAIRLAWFWKALEPRRGQFDRGYLTDLKRDVDVLADHHILTLLEAHQDGYNEALGGAGFPDWATVGIPVSGASSGGILDTTAWSAFDNLYANTSGIARALASAWRVVATELRGEPMLLGYDLMNEPHPGSRSPACLQAAGCPVFDRTLLQPLENRLAAAVRSADPATIAFYEPNAFFNVGALSSLDAPPPTSGPSAFAFHDYCLIGLLGTPDHESQDRDYPLCERLDEKVFANALSTASAMGVPALLGEFGDTQDLADIERVIGLADSNLTGWIYWSYKDWVDIPGGGGSGPLFDDSDDNGTLRRAKLAVLSEPYPVATAGTPLSERYDPTADTFSYRFAPDRAVAAPTVIFTSPLRYPHGYAVSVQGATVLSRPSARYLQLRALPGRPSVSVRLTAVPGQYAGAPPRPLVRERASARAPLRPARIRAEQILPPAAGGPGGLGTASGGCDANAGNPTPINSPLPRTGGRDVIARVFTRGGSGEVTMPSGLSVKFGGGDAAWVDLGVFGSGRSAQASVICRSGPAFYQFSFSFAPAPPATFSGQSTYLANESVASSRLAFRVPRAGHYQTEVDVTQGGIELGLRGPNGSTPPARTFLAPGSMELGRLEPGLASLDVVALPGAPASWVISIRPANHSLAATPRWGRPRSASGRVR